MPSTPNLALPYPALTDTPDVPYWLQQLAQGVDALLGGDWVAYTPTWTASTPPVLNNGTLSAFHRTVGKTVQFRVSITMGSTTTYGAGQWNLSLPYPPKLDKWRFADATAWDSSAGAYYATSGTWNNAGSLMALWTPGTTAGGADRALNPTQPFTWAVGDVFTIHGEYERV